MANVDPNELPLTLSQLSARLAELGISGVSISTLRKLVDDGKLAANRTGAIRSTVNAYLAARGVALTPKVEAGA